MLPDVDLKVELYFHMYVSKSKNRLGKPEKNIFYYLFKSVNYFGKWHWLCTQWLLVGLGCYKL